ALALLAPLLALLAAAVCLDSPGPALFRQRRIGRGGREFTMLKFRSMVADAEARRADLAALNEADGPLFKVASDPRVTRVGRWLRASSLDELPQLVNVLRGDMSLVGPRPALPEEVAAYHLRARGRLLVKPGITGLWQVSVRHRCSFDEYLLLDLSYVYGHSMWGDMALLVRTIPVVLGRTGA
ncbi:MAG: sugar transferase, partial [Actinomycetota bacterium]|nr:sugar transferase [Actinomycetota bacterium]